MFEGISSRKPRGGYLRLVYLAGFSTTNPSTIWGVVWRGNASTNKRPTIQNSSYDRQSPVYARRCEVSLNFLGNSVGSLCN